MTLKQFVAFALVASCSSAAWGDDAKDDALEGAWLPSVAELGGKKFPDEVRKTIRLEVKGNQYTVTVGTEPDRGTCKLRLSPREVEKRRVVARIPVVAQVLSSAWSPHPDPWTTSRDFVA